MSNKAIFLIGLVAVTLWGCAKDNLETTFQQREKISFRVSVADFSLQPTKATAVTAAPSSIKVSAVNGSAGADAEIWSNVLFTKETGVDVWQSSMLWPESDQHYRFYAVYPTSYAMTFAAGGPTITATNANDIIAAYAGSPTYNSASGNAMVFNHIFSRLTALTVVSEYDLSDVSIKLTPRTGGTYNLYAGNGKTDGTGWSSVTQGAQMVVANAAGLNEMDLYLVPGEYELTATWTATIGNYEQTFTNKTAVVNLVAGKTNKVTATLNASAVPIMLSVSLTPWSDRSVDVEFPIDD